MTKMSSSYLGNLRIKSKHEQSGTQLTTDAPLDNNGKGESFSPTDLLATAYMNCMMTIIGIYCDKHDIPFKKGKAEVEKIMASSPRRVSQLNLSFDFRGNGWDKKTQQRIEKAGKTCPVAKSVSPEIAIHLSFNYD